MFQLLVVALSFLGMAPQALGLPSSFWCQDFVTKVVNEANQTGGGNSPSQVVNNGVEFEPTPGGIVGINVGTDNAPEDYTFHVAVIESVDPDGSVNVIEGNGADSTKVTRNNYKKNRITKTVITPEAHEEYIDSLCRDLQEVKPWIDWGCESY